MSEEESLNTAFKSYFLQLNAEDKKTIPAEFQPYLLTDSGWNSTKTNAGYKLTKWHKISDQARVAAHLTAVKAGADWKFSNLTFEQVHTK